MDDNRRLDQLEGALIAGRIPRRLFLGGALATGLLTVGAAQARASELEDVRDAQARNVASMKRSYDYVVVGAGSAGCALVGTLARNRSASILLIEAGDWDTAASVDDPRQWFTNLTTERDWGDVAVPGPGVNNRALPESTGRVVGGGSSINAMTWATPFKADLDHWAAESGDEGWGYRHGHELLKSVEDWQGPPDPAYHGTGGPVWVQPSADPLPLARAVLDGSREAGLPVVDDLNAEREKTGNGFGYINQVIKDGRRHSMARAFLHPVLAQDNVTVLVNTRVDRVLFDGDRAVGVEFVRDGHTGTVRAESEVILSSGGFNTPKILMLSGIGDQTDLRALDIPVRMHAPEVGRNVQDHILHAGCLYEAPEPFEYRNSSSNVAGYLTTDARFELPDVSVVEIEQPFASDVITAQYNPPPTTFALCAGLVTPESRGTVKLRSADPAARPVVDMQFLSVPDDVAKLQRGIEVARSIGASAAMKPFVKREVAPGRTLEDQELVDFIRNGATTYWHSSGACRMGKDDRAVVDSRLRVKGVRNLRIADSTIMPRIVSVPTMPACVLIGLRLAEMLARDGRG